MASDQLVELFVIRNVYNCIADIPDAPFYWRSTKRSDQNNFAPQQPVPPCQAVGQLGKRIRQNRMLQGPQKGRNIFATLANLVCRESAYTIKITGMKKRVPPYLSYTTFRNFLDSLRATALPTRIDRGIMANMSGSNQALLLSTARYFGLATDNGIPTPDLKQLVDAEDTDRRQIWKRIFLKGYSDVLGSNIDLAHTTTDEITGAFRRQGINSPERMRKCVTFFMLAAKDAGIKLSPHIKPYVGRKQETRNSRTKGAERQAASALPAAETSEDLFDLQLPNIPDFDPAWPEEVRNNWLDAYARLVIIRREALKG